MLTKSFCLLPQREILSVAGLERKLFLQGLISNNVDRISHEIAIYAALLTPQGKLLHDLFLTEINDTLFLDTERSEDLKMRLLRFRLRAKVTLTTEKTLAVVVAFGTSTASVSGIEEIRVALTEESIVYTDPRIPEIGLRLIGPLQPLRLSLEQVGYKEVPVTAYDKLRLRLGIPDGSKDMVVGRIGPLECGFKELNGVDFSKGCYIGQEVITRSQFRGLIKKRLIPVVIKGSIPELSTPLMLDTQEVGEMRSAIEDIGLAVIKLEAILQAEKHSLLLTSGSTYLIPKRPAWMVLPY